MSSRLSVKSTNSAFLYLQQEQDADAMIDVSAQLSCIEKDEDSVTESESWWQNETVELLIYVI